MNIERFVKQNTLLVAVVMFLGFLYLQSSGFLTGFPLSAVTLTDIQSGYIFAEPNYATILCEQGGETSETFILKPSFLGSVSNTTKIEFENSVISSVTGKGCGYLLEVFDTSTNNRICSFSSSSNTCSGTSLVYGKSYTFKASGGCFFGLGETSLTTVIRGYPLWLNYYAPNGAFGWQIPETRNCLAQDWIANLNKIPEAQSITGTFSSTNISQRSVNLVKGQSFTQQLYYTATVPLYSTFKTDSGELIPIQCDQYNRILKGFAKVTGLNGQNYAIPDSSQIIRQGADPTKPYYIDKFCCNSDQCKGYGLSSDYVCGNYRCVLSSSPEAQQGTPCNVVDDCTAKITTNFITDATGKNYQIIPACVSGFCQESKKEIICNPTTTYADNQCCIKQPDSSYKLDSCIGSVRDCTATLGSDACCLANNTLGYSIHATPPSADVKCCADETGIGKFKASCEEKLEFNLLPDLGKWFKDFLSGLGIKLPEIKAEILGILLLILIILIIFKLKKTSPTGSQIVIVK